MTKIIIADDNPQNIYMLEVLLNGNGYDVVSAVNGKDALNLAKNNPPDLIVSDILMPVMDGFELCRRCKADASLYRIPLIFYTATYTDSEDELFARKLGADRFIVKPQKPEVILRIIREVLEESKNQNNISIPIPLDNKSEIVEQYNEVLFRKLQQKVMQLEREISVRMQIEEKLKLSEERYQTMADYTYDWEYWRAFDESVVYMSPSCERITGYRMEEFIANPYLIEEIIFPEDKEVFINHKSIIKSDAGETKSHEIDFRIVRRDGEICWINHNCRSIIRADGTNAGVRSTNRDVTIRKNVEFALTQSEKEYNTLYNSIMDSLVSVNMDGNIIECNDAFKTMLGYSDEELRSLTFFDLTPSKWHEFETRIVNEQILKRGYSDIYEKEYIRKDGSVFPVELRSYLIKDDNGRSTGMWAIVRDISERKRTQEALQNISAELQLIFKNMINAFVVWESVFDENGKYVSFRFGQFNDAYAKISKVKLEEVQGKDVFEVWPKTEQSWVYVYGQVALTGIPQTFDMYHDPTNGWYHCNAYRPTDSPAQICVIFEDITERKQAVEEIEFRNIILNTQQEASIDGILVLNEKGESISFNRRFLYMWKIKSNEEETNFCENAIQTVVDQLAKPEQFLERNRYLRDHPGEISRDEIARIDGRIFDSYSAPMNATNGKNYGRVWYFRDITERKKSEEKTLRLLQEKEILLNEVFHRVKNNLQIVLSIIGMQTRLEKSPHTKESLVIADNRIRSISIIHELMYDSKNFSEIKPDMYISSLIYHLIGIYNKTGEIKLSVDTSDIILSINTMIPLGVIINECSTNALRHAFAGRDYGAIDVTLSKKNDEYELIFSDDGCGLPSGVDINREKTLGFNLIVNLANQIRGTAEVLPQMGTVIRIRFAGSSASSYHDLETLQ